MPQDKKFVPGKGMVPVGKTAGAKAPGAKKEAVPPKKSAAVAKKETASKVKTKTTKKK